MDRSLLVPVCTLLPLSPPVSFAPLSSLWVELPLNGHDTVLLVNAPNGSNAIIPIIVEQITVFNAFNCVHFYLCSVYAHVLYCISCFFSFALYIVLLPV